MAPSSQALLVAAALALAGPLAAAPARAAPAAPHSQEQLFKDFGGGLWRPVKPLPLDVFETLPMPFNAEWQTKRAEAVKTRAEGRQVFTGDSRCIPAGMPRMMMMLGTAFEVLVRPNSLGLSMAAAGGLQIRNIWTDGRKHTAPDDLFETFSGESVGRWEGDTLVVTTIGIRPTNEIIYGVQAPGMTTTERFRKTGPDALEVKLVVEDAAVFTEPFAITLNFRRQAGATLNENEYCVAALDRSVNQQGVEEMNLIPPPDPRGK